ncbi:hypothetical protein QBC47DRAFT_445664 [Echria macrotheca]|uniref:Acyl-coenzyme A oxidase n=1 Tax=Echria macrotheca TaxID=438768 RepID=A0AAJ0BCI3_9PEZI|nr:hypothetical protein QBC47DRAFT_445664 [Echria macrotheca]
MGPEPEENAQIRLMRKARGRTSFPVEDLTTFIYGSPETVQKRRAAWHRVELALDSTDTTKLPPQYAKTSREDLYLDGLRMGKAAWDDQLQHDHAFFEWLTPRYTACNASPFGLTAIFFARTIELMGSPEQKSKWLPLIQSGHINGAYAQTELGHGSFVRGLETTATFDPASDSFVVNSPTLTSTKFWPGALGFSATHAVLMAKLITRDKDHGVHPFIVPLRDPETGKPMEGIELGDVGPKPSYNQTDNGYARFDNVSIPRSNMLMGHATVSSDGSYQKRPDVHVKAAYGSMLRTRAKMIWICAVQLAAAVAIAVRYSTVRQQGTLPYAEADGTETAIIHYRSQNSRLLTHLSRAYAILFASRRANDIYQDFESRQATRDFSTMTETHAVLSGIKAWATTLAADGAEDARKSCGAAGYLAISGLPELVQSATALCTLEGENYVLWQQAARELVKWAPKLSSNNLPSALRYLAGKYTPGQKCTATIPTAFLLPETQLEIFKHRSRRLISKSHRLFSASVSSGDSPSQAWNNNVTLLISAARAHVEYLVLQAFIASVSSMTTSPLKTTMTNLCSLFALTTIITGEAHCTFSEDGYLSETQLDAVRAQVNALLDTLVPDAVGLTDAWDFTDAGLASAIGMRDGDVYARVMAWTRQLPVNSSDQQVVVGRGWDEFIRPALNRGGRKL